MPTLQGWAEEEEEEERRGVTREPGEEQEMAVSWKPRRKVQLKGR